MKKIFIALVVVLVLVAAFYALNAYIYNEKQGDAPPMSSETKIDVMPVSHASLYLKWGDKIILTDPVGDAGLFANQPDADIILITDLHSDHYNAERLQAVTKDKTKIFAPKAVADVLPEALKAKVNAIANGQVANEGGMSIQAVAAYNLPESATAYHVKGRGNGYVLESAGKRVYVSGDTSDIPEMRALQDIDIAFLCMNLPYTMSVESAADAVLEFNPKQVYPYHYRGQNGMSDVGKFKQLVETGSQDIEVVQLDWYQ